MLTSLRALFGSQRAEKPASTAQEVTAFDPVEMVWYDDTRLPLPVWQRIAEVERPEWTPAQHDAFRTAAAGH